MKPSLRFLCLPFLGGICACVVPCADSFAADGSSPYGVCAHVADAEFSGLESTLGMLGPAGVGNIRCDFQWDKIEKPKGVRNFAKCDEVVAKAAHAESEVILSGPLAAKQALHYAIVAKGLTGG